MEWQRYLQQQRGGQVGRGAARGYQAPVRAYTPAAAPRGAQANRGAGRGAALPVRAAPQAQFVQRAQMPATQTAYQPRAIPQMRPTSQQPQQQVAAQVQASAPPVSLPNAEKIFTYTEKERFISALTHRYPKLSVSNDFLKMVCHWPEVDATIPLDKHVEFKSDPAATLPVPAEEEAAEGPKHIARVMLLSAAKDEPQADEKTPKPHLAKQLKFLVAKKANQGLMAIGGAWSKSKDGGDPTKDATLIKTATRHCKEICGVDLSKCKQWFKFIEIVYNRSTGVKDRTVFFVPDVWNHMTGEVKVYKQVSQTEQEAEEEVEVEVDLEESEKTEGGPTTKTVKKKVTTKKTVEQVVIRSMDLSLNGVLEYDLNDNNESTSELSLFAECFYEMVSFQKAKKLREIVLKKKETVDKQTNELKRKREEEAEERRAKMATDQAEREAKRQKLDEQRKALEEVAKKRAEEEKYMTEEEIKERRTKEAEEKKVKDEAERKEREAEAAKRKEEVEKKRAEIEAARKKKEEEEAAKTTKTVTVTTTHVDQSIMEPFLWFDRAAGATQPTNNVSRATLESALYGLGDCTLRECNAILAALGLPKERPQFNLFYKTLACTTTTTTKEVPKEEPKAEEPKAEEAAAETKENAMDES